MARTIKRAAVLGSGVMGSGIAAHLAGVGIKTLLLDIVPPSLSEEDTKKGLTTDHKVFRNRFASSNLEKAVKGKPPVFYNVDDAALIEVGNFDDDLGKIRDCDWIVEAVTENLEIKRALFAKIDAVRKQGALVTSNTSGLSIASMTEGRTPDFVQNFFVTHFFNPVRFMRLLEVVAGEQTDRTALDEMSRFGADRLGKGIVFGKDTPNFVANRIGVFGMMYLLHAMLRDGFSIEEVDAVFGPATGRPKSAVFRTADMVGLDTLCHVADHCYASLGSDEQRDVFKVPDHLREMVKRGILGQKTKGGYYKKQGDAILAIDPRTLEYHPSVKIKADSLGAVRGIESVGEKIKLMVNAGDKYGKLAWDALARTLIYSANRLGEIADDVVNCDNAMKWGFNWELGPFETWDAIGVKESVERMAREGMQVPRRVTEMLERGRSSFYGGSATVPTYFDFGKGAESPVPIDPRSIRIPALKEQNQILKENPSATIYDIGDGVLLLEFHSKMNAVDGDIVSLLHGAIDLAEKEGWNGIVIGNEHKESFSAGANLFFLLMAIKQGMWSAVEKLVDGFQAANLRLRQCDVPTVAAPAGLALGGGAEVMMGADAIRAHAELYAGLVEVGVGLIPGGGGTLEMLERFCGNLPDDPSFDPLPFVKGAFTNIAMAKVSVGAEDGRKLGYLKPSDGVTLNRELLIHDAKQTVLGMARAGYRPPRPINFRLPGPNGAAAFRWFLDTMRLGNQITEHEFKIASKLAWVLCGGETSTRHKVSQQRILELEKEAFLSLCGEAKSQERMQYMLEKNKPLRN
ncbi:MAG: 3-hydroxyacyl-CoA dehydrogenase [Acidobacteriota bacterium]|nr:3-hydroxyacyl-CoA dehydrogenase [Acidobacteriota bacterium]